MVTKNLREVLAKNLKAKRKALDISQEKFAELAKVNRNYPGMVERCEVNIRLVMIHQLAKAVDTSVCILLGGSVIPSRHVSITALFSANVKKIRLELGLSQDDIGKRGFARTYVSAIERGRSSVSIDTIEKLANAMRIKPYRFFE